MAFAELGSYGDSPRYFMYCNAIVAGEAGFYTTAVENLQSLDSFLDSKLLAAYYAGLSWEVTEDYEKAADVMSGISLYKDVSTRIASYPEKINARDYKRADANEKAENLESALSGFKALGNYKDSAARAEAVQEKICARNYTAADQAEQAGKLEAALASFKALGSYKDSIDRAAAVQTKIDERDAAAAEQAKTDAYAAADKAEQAGDFITAYDGFIQLGDYSDCKERAAAIKAPAEYAKGMAAIDKGNYKEAYAFFDGLGDYKDSKERAYALGISNYAKLTTVAQGVATFVFHNSYGFVNFNEGVLIAPKWSSVSVLSDDRIAVCKDEKYAVINMSGNFICDYRWTQISSYNEQGICTIASEVGSGWSSETVFGLMNKDGKVLASCEWSKLGDSSYYASTPVFADGRILVKSQDGKYGFLSDTGSLVVRAVYDKANDFSNGLAAVKSGSNWGYIDPNNKTVIDFRYQEAYSFTSAGTADVCRNGEWQIIDKEGNVIYFKSFSKAEQEETSTNEAVETNAEEVKNTATDAIKAATDAAAETTEKAEKDIAKLVAEAKEAVAETIEAVEETVAETTKKAAPAGKLADKTVILHSNDVHGAIAGYAYMAAQKAAFEAEGANVILADIGDFSQGDIYVSSSKGATAFEIMNAVGYDVITLGNHEFDFGYAQLMENAANASFQVICDNVVLMENGETVFPATAIIEKDGLKIGFFGVETPETATKVNPGLIKEINFLTYDALYEATQNAIDSLRGEGVDLVFGLTHLGVDEESAAGGNRSIDLLAKINGVDMLLDGHSHTIMTEAEGGLPIQSTGTKFAYIGVVVIDNETKAIEDHYLLKTAALAEGEELPEGVKIVLPEGEALPKDEAVAAKADEIIAKVDEEYNTVFADTEILLNGERAPGNRNMETNLGDLITDAMVWSVTKADGALSDEIAGVVGITNGGGIRATVEAGDISKKNINTVLPFGNTVAVIYVKGSELLEALEASTFAAPEAIGGYPQTSGIRFTVDTTKAFDQGKLYTLNGKETTYHVPASIQRVTIEKIGEADFDPEAIYAVVTNNFIAEGGDTYAVFNRAYVLGLGFDTGIPMDQAVMDYITDVLNGKITAEAYGEPAGRETQIPMR